MNALISTFGVDWYSLGFEVVNFGILVALLTWLLYKPVLAMVRERERVVTKGVEDAEAAAEKLAQADEVVSKLVKGAEVEAEAIVKSAHGEATVEKSKILSEAEARAAQIAKDAEARAVETAVRSARESEREIARLAILAAEKVMKKSA